VSFQVAGHQTEKYTVSTPLYEGPLDLLLQLIERAELDITRLALAQVTDQYLAYLQNLQDRDPAEVSAFLVIAARLVQIKSTALLPRQPVEPSGEEEEDPGEALARQLLLYKRFKELSAWMAGRETNNLRTYLRLAPPPVKVEPRLDLSGVTLADLVRAAGEIFASQPDLPLLSRVVSMPRVTIREKIHLIVERLRQADLTSFRSLLSPQRTRLEVVITFLAMLELIKRKTIHAEQTDLFGEIQIQSSGDLENGEEGDLEFGD